MVTCWIRPSQLMHQPLGGKIEHGLELLKKCVIWRDGDGEKIRIWRDNWLPRFQGLKVLRSKRTCRLKWVAQIMTEDKKGWNTGLVDRVFLPHDAKVIKSIKIPERDHEDLVAWNYEKSGIFTVRIAYWLSMQLDDQIQSTGSSRYPDGSRPVWKRVWKLGVPPKVKIFVWRLIKEGLASKKTKANRRLAANGLCQLCGREEESAYHAVIKCLHTLELRKAMREVWLPPDESKLRWTGPDWLLLLFAEQEMEMNDRLALLLWRSWFVRNEAVHVHNGVRVEPEASVAFLCNYEHMILSNVVADGRLVNKGKQTIRKSEDQRTISAGKAGEPVKETNVAHKWRPQESGWVAVSVDGAFDADTKRAGVGIVIRDEKGSVILSSWRAIFDGVSAEKTEGRACLEGLRLAKEWTQQKVVIESDCATIINVIKHVEENRSELVFLLKEIKVWGSKFPDVRFSYISRNCSVEVSGT